MATNSIRVGSKSRYSIEVNDRGDQIFFDLADTKLPAKLFEMYEAVDLATKKYTDLAEMAKKVVTGKKKAGSNSITEEQYASAKLLDAFYIEARAALDLFLGEGACQKIFGDDNYTDMFNDLMEQLEPHFKKMGLNTLAMKAQIAKKYLPEKTGTALK